MLIKRRRAGRGVAALSSVVREGNTAAPRNGLGARELSAVIAANGLKKKTPQRILVRGLPTLNLVLPVRGISGRGWIKRPSMATQSCTEAGREKRSATYASNRSHTCSAPICWLRPFCDLFASYSAHAGGEYDYDNVSLGTAVRQPRRSNVDQLRPRDHGIGETRLLNV